MRYRRELQAAFRASIPVMMGYGVLGFAFGLLMSSEEYSWGLPVLMSIVIYAGALQFLALGFFQAKAGLWQIFIASIFVNIRQAFYGLSLLKKFRAPLKIPTQTQNPSAKGNIFGIPPRNWSGTSCKST